jgi:hypothetical protein
MGTFYPEKDVIALSLTGNSGVRRVPTVIGAGTSIITAQSEKCGRAPALGAKSEAAISPPTTYAIRGFDLNIISLSSNQSSL